LRAVASSSEHKPTTRAWWIAERLDPERSWEGTAERLLAAGTARACKYQVQRRAADKEGEESVYGEIGSAVAPWGENKGNQRES
jgi:hypothetical protein